MPKQVALGLDFGTESVRALLIDLQGNRVGGAVSQYRHRQITETLPGSNEKLPQGFAFQHPNDWIESSSEAIRDALRESGQSPDTVTSIGVDFTSCTMLPTLRDGTPLCLTESFSREKFAWPKLWKHHGAQKQTDRCNEVARRRNENWLTQYGGTIGLEWFFPKILETLEEAPSVYRATEVWVEAGDWYVWQLVGTEAEELPRSTCQAGYKALWSRGEGYPSEEFFAALHPEMIHVVREKMPGQLVAPGQRAGELSRTMAQKLGLRAGIPVSAAVIDAHAAVPGVGAAEPGTLVMVLGTSNCHMLNAYEERSIPGVAGVVYEGILPGLYGYETGQAAAGDAFDWLRRTVGHNDFNQLTEEAKQLPPGSEGALCLDWLNGCRTPLMDGSLTGAFVGLTLDHGPHHLYRALLEGSAYGLRWIVDLFRSNGLPVERLVATGGLPHSNPFLVQIYADVLGQPIRVAPPRHGPALGAAILGVLAAGPKVTGFESAQAAIETMTQTVSNVTEAQPSMVHPNPTAKQAYDHCYDQYLQLGETIRPFLKALG